MLSFCLFCVLFCFVFLMSWTVCTSLYIDLLRFQEREVCVRTNPLPWRLLWGVLHFLWFPVKDPGPLFCVCVSSVSLNNWPSSFNCTNQILHQPQNQQAFSSQLSLWSWLQLQYRLKKSCLRVCIPLWLLVPASCPSVTADSGYLHRYGVATWAVEGASCSGKDNGA